MRISWLDSSLKQTRLHQLFVHGSTATAKLGDGADDDRYVTEISSALNMSRATIYRYIDQRKQLVIG